MEERLQKYLARAGVLSRRKAEEAILAGKVAVNGVVVTALGTKVSSVDEVTYCGKKVQPASAYQYYMLHKPEGYVTTVHDQFGRPCVLDLVPQEVRLYPVGRLDYETSGLLLLTNDGDLTYELTHPAHQVEKTYIALVRGIPTESELQRFRQGILLDDRLTAPAKIRILNKEGNNARLEIKIHEGRNRQVRRMCQAISHPVLQLSRCAIGTLRLGDLPKGSCRLLQPEEIAELKRVANVK